MGFDFGGNFGINLGGLAQGGGLGGGGTVFDPGAGAFSRMNTGQQQLNNQAQVSQNLINLGFDRRQFQQKMALADEFGINKLAMLGQSNTSGSSATFQSPDSSIGFQPTHRDVSDPRDSHLKDNQVKISDAEVRSANARADVDEVNAYTRALHSTGLTGVGGPPLARSSPDQNVVTKTFSLPGGKPWMLTNPDALQEQYNYGESMATLLNLGIDPRLSLALSSINLMEPTSWATPFLELGHLMSDPLYRDGAAKAVFDRFRYHPRARTLFGTPTDYYAN